MYTTSPLNIYSEILTLTLKQLKPIKYKLKSIGSVIFMPRTLHTRLGRMKTNIFCFILIALLGITISTSIAQQNGDDPKTNTEVEALRKRVSELEDKLKIVENVEKMELAAKLAEAQAELIAVEFDKLKLELKDSNQQWLMTLIYIFLGVLSVVGSSIGYAVWTGLKSKMDTLIATEVEKRIGEFEQSVDKVKILEPKVRILNKEHAASVLERFIDFRPELYPEQVKQLEEQAILDVFSDETRHLEYRIKAAEVLAYRESTELVSPVLNFLKSYIDSDFDWNQDFRTQHLLCDLIYFIAQFRTTDTYEAFKRFLELLLEKDDQEVIRFILTYITFSLAYVSSELNKNDSISIIRKTIPNLDMDSRYGYTFEDLIEYFDKFSDSDGIKEIYNIHAKGRMSEIEAKCLELLEKYEPDFVREERKQKEADTNTESEETDGSEPTT